MKKISNFLTAILLLCGCSFTPAERATAEKCSDVSAVLKNTHNWMMINLVNSNHTAVATIQKGEGAELLWNQRGETEKLTPEQAMARAIQELDGQPGQLMMHYIGQPRRGYYMIDLDASAKVTRVEDYHWAD